MARRDCTQKSEAYTKQLEARLKELKEENASLAKDIAKKDAKRLQELREAMKEKPPTKAEMAAKKLQTMRKRFSCQF